MSDFSIVTGWVLAALITVAGITTIVISNGIQGTERISACVESGNVWTNLGTPGGYSIMGCVPAPVVWSSTANQS